MPKRQLSVSPILRVFGCLSLLKRRNLIVKGWIHQQEIILCKQLSLLSHALVQEYENSTACLVCLFDESELS